MKVCFLTEIGVDIGYGHMTRCLALAQAFEEKGVEIIFEVYAPEEFTNIVGKRKVNVNEWFQPDNCGLCLDGIDIAVIDSYHAPLEIYQNIAKNVKQLVSIDDYNRLNYPQGLVLNGAADAEGIDYPENKNIEYFLGESFIPIRQPFWDVPKRIASDNIENILVMFGGTDSENMTPGIIKELNALYPKTKKNVVIRNRNLNEKKYEQFKTPMTQFIYDCSAENILELMLQADISISASGQTLYELASVGLPTVSICVADNQRGNVRGWLKKGFIEFVGFWKDEDLIDNLSKSLENIQLKDKRQKMANIGQSYVDGQGARRVVSSILERMEAKDNV